MAPSPPRCPGALLARAALGTLAVAEIGARGETVCNSPYNESCWPGLSEADALHPHNEWFRAFFRDGFNIVRNVLTDDQVRRAQSALSSRWKNFGLDPVFGRERQYNLLELDPVFGEFLDMIPGWIDGMMHQTMGPWIVGAYDIYKFNPVKWQVPPEIAYTVTRDSLHSDFPYGHSPMPEKPGHFPHTVQLIFMVTDFSERNGGTIVVPASYKGRLAHAEGKEAAMRNGTFDYVKGRAGDVLVYLGGTWHGNGLNVAEQPRIGVIAQCLPFFFKPMQAQAFTLPQRVIRRLSDRTRYRLALQGYHWFWHTSAGMWMSFPGHKLYHTLDFVTDMLIFSYPSGQQEPLARGLAIVILLWIPLLLWCCYGYKSAMRFACPAWLGICLGVAMCFERFFLS